MPRPTLMFLGLLLAALLSLPLAALTVATPIFNPGGGTYNHPQTVTVTCATDSVSIRYTDNGNDPGLGSPEFPVGGITVSVTSTLKAKAFRTGWTPSATATAVYSLQVSSPTFNPGADTYNSNQSVTITTVTVGDTIRYTTNGTNPTASSPIYTGPISITGTTTIKAIGYKSPWMPSGMTTGEYVLKPQTPEINPSGGTFVENSTHTISITCDTPNVQIRYTLDGPEPTETTGTEYFTPFTIDRNRTIRAKAFSTVWTNWDPSELAQANVYLQAQIPSIEPPAGTYTESSGLQITLNCTTTGATIRYTTDNSDPASSSTFTVYSGPFNIDISCTVKARAFKDNWIESEVRTSVITLKAMAPVSNIPPDVYNSEQNLALSSGTVNTTVHYTLDFSDPTATSPAYTEPIPITQNTTVKARAFRNNWATSEVSIFSYTLMPTTPSFSPPSGTYDSPQQVAISSTPEAEIRFTTDGSDPASSTTYTVYSGSFNLAQNDTVKARAYKNGWTRSELGISMYAYNTASPSFSHESGVYSDTLSVSISAAPGAIIRYTLDGSDPSQDNGITYDDDIHIMANTGIRAMAYVPEWNPSGIVSASYLLQVADPSFGISGDTYPQTQWVSISCATPGSDIYFTTNGADPDSTSTHYDENAVEVAGTTLLQARAFKDGWIPSSVSHAYYEITGQVSFYTPVFSPPPGTYSSAQQITITENTYPTGAQIRFTLDGSEPNEASPLYADPILVSGDTTIKARAFLANWVPSEVQTATYLITGQLTPILSFIPPAGTYTQAQSVSISATGLPSGCQLRYTLDGTPPDENSPPYSEPVELPLNSQTTIRVRAFKEDWEPSAPWSASYTITGAVVLNNLTFAPIPGVYTGEQYISLAAGVDPIDAVLRFTLDGSEPTSASQAYPAIIHIPSGDSLTVKVGAFKDGWIPSQIHTAEYRTVEYASQINVQASYLFAGINGTDYRLVGLPGMVNNPVGQYMQGEHGTDWKLFHEPGGGMDLIPWTQARNFAFTPGRAYWLLSRTPVHITTTQVPAVALDNELCYSLQIHPGWNIITSPFTIAVPWEAVRQSNTTSNYTLVDKLYAYGSGTYSETDNLEAYQGFYFYNRRPNAISLRIPYWWEPEDKAPAVLPPHCEISLAASAASPPLRLGISTQASDELDDLDQFAPPTDFCEYCLSLEDGQLHQEFRQSGNQIFDFQVKAPAGESLALEITAVPGLPNAYLWDKADDSFHALDAEVTYPLLPCHGNFALVTGSADFVQNLRDSLIPGVVSVAQNRPNPFRDFTSIKAGFAGSARVWVEVFNIRGQKVAVLADDTQVRAGTQEWLLDASKLAAGIYLCRVSWDDGKVRDSKTLKMILIR